jgi:hypothetical protein
MVKTILVSIVATLGLATPSAVSPASATPTPLDQVEQRAATGRNSILGTWRGPVILGDGTTAGIRITVKFVRRDGVLRGRAWRSDGRCTGKFTFKRRADGWYRFRQTITSGECTPKHSPVKARRKGARLKVVWYNPETDERAHILGRRIR